MRRLMIAVVIAGCAADLDAGGSGVDAEVGSDPLEVDDAPEPGSFDELHRTVIVPRCSGTPGLCHDGQFEPNLSTPGLAYAYLVHRPAIEQPRKRRVAVGDAGASFLVDKLRGRDVVTRMPLGADPLPEAEIAAIEAWIEAGAPRHPDEDAPEVLNEPPRAPEIGIYDAVSGERLDVGGGATISIGQTIEIRHSVHDFETDDPDIPFGAVVLATAAGDVVLVPAAEEDPHVAVTGYDATAPEGAGDLLNWAFAWTVPATIELYVEATGVRTPVPASGVTMTPIAVYVDAFEDGIATAAFSERALVIE